MHLPPARRFVDRDAETALVHNAYILLKAHQEVPFSLINYHGAPGMGKTALLHSLETRYSKDEKIDIITINLSEMPLDSNLNDAKHYFLRTFDEFTSHIEISDNGHLSQQLNALTGRETTDVLDELLISIADDLVRRPRAVLLLIDSWERTPDALITWVERLLLLPLVRANKIIGAFGSQVALRWRQFEVRRRVKAQPLGPLDTEYTQQQLDDDPDISQAVYAMTFGHPFANEVVFKYVLDQSRLDQEAPGEWLATHREQVAQHIIEKLHQRVLADVSQELKDIFGVLALFREFDVNTLRTVLPKFYPDFKHRSQSALLISIKQLLDTRLVSWSDEMRAYQIDATVRQIFAHALELINAQRYSEIRAAAKEYYDRLIRDIPGGRNVYVAEYLYHDLNSAQPKEYYQTDLQQQFRNFLTYYKSPDGKITDTQALDGLRQILERDMELHAALQRQRIAPTLLLDTLDEFRAHKLPG